MPVSPESRDWCWKRRAAFRFACGLVCAWASSVSIAWAQGVPATTGPSVPSDGSAPPGPRETVAGPDATTAHAGQGPKAIVVSKEAYVYERPDRYAPLVRRLYVGEVVDLVGPAAAKSDGTRWAKVAIGRERTGYVPFEALADVDAVETAPWDPPRVLRDERPLSLMLRFGAETFGGAALVRYQPFTRLGVGAAAGAVHDRGRFRGTSFGGGLVFVPMATDLQPLVEVGMNRLNYRASQTTLRATNLYAGLHLEWMFESGLFASAGVAYFVNTALEVSVDYSSAGDRTFRKESYGSLDPRGRRPFQGVRPGASVGYAF